MANKLFYKSRPMHFSLSLTISEIIIFQIFYFKKVGQGHKVKILQWRHSMENIIVYRSAAMHFCISSRHFRDINISDLLHSESRSRSIIFAVLTLDGKYQNLLGHPKHFCASSNHFRDINISYFLPSTSRSRSWCIIFSMMPFNGKYRNLWESFLHFLFSLRYELCSQN